MQRVLNADEHALMGNFHKPSDEKRMVVMLHEATYNDWLTTPATQSVDFMRAYSADQLVAAGESEAMGGLF